MNTVIADQSRFEVENIELTNYGETIIASNGKFTSIDRNLIIRAEKFSYNKNDNILNVSSGIADIKSNNLKIKFDESKYNENNFKLTAKGNIKINDSENNLLIESDVITIDRNKDFITAKKY